MSFMAFLPFFFEFSFWKEGVARGEWKKTKRKEEKGVARKRNVRGEKVDGKTHKVIERER